MTDYWLNARGEKIIPAERRLLYNLARRISYQFGDPIIVNIGVSWGASLHCLVAGAPEATHIAIDIDYDKRPVQGKELLSVVEFIDSDSATYPFFGMAHLVFVDGNHTFRGVSGDIANWEPHIPVGGLIVFHDYEPAERDAKRLEGVKRAVDTWRNEGWQQVGSAGSIVAFKRI